MLRFISLRSLTGAHSCLHTQFRCENNVCIPKWQVCDGVTHCRDGSDERSCSAVAIGCNATQFKCANRKCIPNGFVCDSKDDCGDASDEKYCGKLVTAAKHRACARGSNFMCIISKKSKRNNRCHAKFAFIKIK